MTDKPLYEMTDQELTDVWNKRVSKLLVGRKIKKFIARSKIKIIFLLWIVLVLTFLL